MKIDVIGAGIVGLATAVTCAVRGASVRVFDPAPASGATHHAGGMLAPAAEVVYRQEPLFPLMLASAKLWPELLRDVATHTDLPTGHRSEGTLVVAADRADAQHLRELQEYQTAHGMTVERLTLRQARGLEPALSPALAGAVSLPGDHQVAPRVFATAARDAALNLGVEFVPRAVDTLHDPELACQDGGQVVIANGLGASALVPGLQLRPVYGDILRVRVPERQFPLCERVIRGFVEDRPVYVIPRADGTVAIGATSREDGRPTPRLGDVHDLLRDAIRLVPGLEDCDLLEATTGARPGTPDDLPYLGRITPTAVLSTGYFRHGILLAALAARATADVLEGTTPTTDLSACAPLRHNPNEGAS